MKLIASVIVAMTALLASTVGAADATHDLKATLETCFACHGANGISQMDKVPSLAGQQNNYLQWQLVYFRSKNRKNEIMQPLTANLTDPDIRAIGDYFAKLTPQGAPSAADPNPALFAMGASIAKTRNCASCHGDHFEGQKAALRIVNQREEYLFKSLKDYLTGQRAGGGVLAMPDAVYGMSEDELKAVAHYLSWQKAD